jgi:hypothetical protein
LSGFLLPPGSQISYLVEETSKSGPSSCSFEVLSNRSHEELIQDIDNITSLEIFPVGCDWLGLPRCVKTLNSVSNVASLRLAESP